MYSDLILENFSFSPSNTYFKTNRFLKRIGNFLKNEYYCFIKLINECKNNVNFVILQNLPFLPLNTTCRVKINYEKVQCSKSNDFTGLSFNNYFKTICIHHLSIWKQLLFKNFSKNLLFWNKALFFY